MRSILAAALFMVVAIGVGAPQPAAADDPPAGNLVRCDPDYVTDPVDHTVALHFNASGGTWPVADMRVSEDPTFADTDWQPYQTPLTFVLSPGDGIKPIHVQWRDTHGNLSAVSGNPCTVDTSPPVGLVRVNHGAISTTSTAVVLDLQASDLTEVNGFKIWNEGGAVDENYNQNPDAGIHWEWMLPPGDGTKTVYVQYVDRLGHWSLPSSTAIDLDTTVDGGEYGLSIDRGAVFTSTTSVILDIPAVAGTAEMRISNDGGFVGAVWEPYSAHRAWTINGFGDQVFTAVVYVRFRDAYGDIVGGTLQDDIILDTNPPTAVGGATLANGDDILTAPDSAPESSPVPAASASSGPAIATGPTVVPTFVRTVKLNTAAVDDRSGVAMMQVSNDRRFLGSFWEPYAPTRAWPVDTGSAATVWIRFRDGAGNTSGATKHKLTATRTPTVVTQVAPVHLQTQATRSPTFRWSALSGATRYQLQVAAASSFARSALLLSRTVSTTSFASTAALPADKQLYWRVRKTNGVWSPVWKFRTPVASAPAQSQPGPKAVTTTLSPSLSWAAVPRATGYGVQLGVEATFSSGVRTFAVSGTSLDLPSLAANASYVWRVRAKVGDAWSGWSPARSFTTPALGRVVLASPADGAKPAAGPVTLDWSDVAGADHYDVQVCSDSACSNVERSPDPDSSLVVIAGLPSGDHWWRVRAIGPSAEQGAWSAIRRFTR